MNPTLSLERLRFNMIEQQIRPWDVLFNHVEAKALQRKGGVHVLFLGRTQDKPSILGVGSRGSAAGDVFGVPLQRRRAQFARSSM